MPAAAPFLIHVSPGHVARVLRSDSASFAGLHTSEIKQTGGVVAIVARRDGLSMLHFDQRMNPQLLIREMQCDPESCQDSQVYLYFLPFKTESPVVSMRLTTALQSYVESTRTGPLNKRMKVIAQLQNEEDNEESEVRTDSHHHIVAVFDSLQVDSPIRKDCVHTLHEPARGLRMYSTAHQDSLPFRADQIAYHPQHARLMIARACEQLWGARQRLVDAANQTPFQESDLKPLYKAQPALLFDGQHWLKPHARDLAPQSNEAHDEQKMCRISFAMCGFAGLLFTCTQMVDKIEDTMENSPFGGIHLQFNSRRHASDFITWMTHFQNSENSDSDKSTGEAQDSAFTVQAVMDAIWHQLETPMHLLLTAEERKPFERARELNLPHAWLVQLNRSACNAEILSFTQLIALAALASSTSSPAAAAAAAANAQSIKGAGLAMCGLTIQEASGRVKLAQEHEMRMQHHSQAKEAINSVLSLKEKATQKQKSDAITLVRASCLAGDGLFKLCDRLSSKSTPASAAAPASSPASAQ